ncbi:MAG: ATP-dependent helicase [Candidatus Limnocylindrales bacterium]
MTGSATAAERLLEDLNDAQREAVRTTSGPLAILAGAGTGKTRVISRRTAYAIATGVVTPAEVLVVTFTDKAAGEMVERLAALGHRSITARTFHAHALRQLRHFWPSGHDGEPLPAILESKYPIVGRLARALPGGFRFTPVRDLIDEIEWAKSRRIAPQVYPVEAASRVPPIPVELFARLYGDYEKAKERARRIDFDDMLSLTVDLLETDAAALSMVRARKRWFSVDEYQDTSPLQERLLELWAGDATDLCVVGDEDQTIYTFTGATSAFLTGFASRHPDARVIALTENYRSTPQVLELANRLIARSGRQKVLVPTRPAGPSPTVRSFPDAERELQAITTGMARLIADRVVPAEIAVLVRMNAQLAPIEQALTKAGIAYAVRGQRFYERRDVRDAIAAIRRGGLTEAAGPALVGAIVARWHDELGYEPGVDPDAPEARERAAAFAVLEAIIAERAAADAGLDAEGILADLAGRDAAELAGQGDGVNLLTYHRAKGLEWDAVFLPLLEEGSLPIHHAFDDEASLDEERRLLYVGITRARVHLTLSWAESRPGTTGRETRRRPSRFLADLAPARPLQPPVRPRGRVTVLPGAPRPVVRDGEPLIEALRAWRLERARADAVPAYVVAHDATLEAIAEARPVSIAALRRVKGMGPAKLDRYGAEILELVARVPG